MLYFTPELFLDAIVLLINDQSEDVRRATQRMIDIFNEEIKHNSSLNQDIMVFYCSLLQEILDNKCTIENKEDLLVVLLKFKSNPAMSKDPSTYNLLEQLFSSSNQLSTRKHNQLRERLRNSSVWYDCSKHIRKMFGKLSAVTESKDSQQQCNLLAEVRSQARKLEEIFSINTPTADALERIDLNDKNSIRNGLEIYENRKVKSVFKTGLQGLNKILGKRGGFTLGDSMVFYGLSHHYKSGMLISFARWIAQYNSPKIKYEGIPTILFVSLENEANENLVQWYRSVYELNTGQSSEGKSIDEVVDYLYEFFNQSGFRLIIERRMPNEFGYDEYVAMFEEYRARGFHILFSIIDYLALMKKGTMGSKGAEAEHIGIKNLCNNMCNFHKNRGCTMVTAHQLNRGASEIAASGQTNVVKRFGPNHIAGSVDVEREFDFSCYMYIERNQHGRPFLTLKRGKHRYVNDTPEKDMYCAYPFGNFGIEDDIEGEPKFVRNIYAVEYDGDAVDSNGNVTTSSDALF